MRVLNRRERTARARPASPWRSAVEGAYHLTSTQRRALLRFLESNGTIRRLPTDTKKKGLQP